MNSMIPEGQPCAVLDIKDCFFSIPLHEEDKERFAFSVMFPNSQRPNLRFQWKVLPQGMINSPTICQITVDRRSDPTATIIQYMDDILIAAPSGSQVDQLVSMVSETLKTNGFEIASAKIKRGPCDRIIGHPRNPYTPVTREDDKLASILSKPGNSALAETKQRQNNLRGGGPRCLCVVLILELVTIEQVNFFTADRLLYLP
ncbi:hypothetical protein GRJ2_001852400 [Grus japonensis]|uniref:ribonuclease H n=1 Tax=Grus japonensis TaxID=30415 RepID=A0ABC9X850_GRUJA